MAKRLGTFWDYIFRRENKPFKLLFFQGPGRLSEKPSFLVSMLDFAGCTDFLLYTGNGYHPNPGCSNDGPGSSKLHADKLQIFIDFSFKIIKPVALRILDPPLEG